MTRFVTDWLAHHKPGKGHPERTVKSFAFQEAESISRRAKVCWAARNGHAVLSLQHDGIVVAVKRGSDAGDVAEQMAGASEEALGYRQPCELKDQEPPSGVARPQLATRDEVGRVVPGLGEMEGLSPRHGAWVRDAELQEDPRLHASYCGGTSLKPGQGRCQTETGRRS